MGELILSVPAWLWVLVYFLISLQHLLNTMQNSFVSGKLYDFWCMVADDVLTFEQFQRLVFLVMFLFGPVICFIIWLSELINKLKTNEDEVD